MEIDRRDLFNRRREEDKDTIFVVHEKDNSGRIIKILDSFKNIIDASNYVKSLHSEKNIEIVEIRF